MFTVAVAAGAGKLLPWLLMLVAACGWEFAVGVLKAVEGNGGRR